MEKGIACSELTLDQEENIWFHMFPSETIDMLDTKNDRIASGGASGI